MMNDFNAGGFFVSILIVLIFLIAGIILYFFPPKNINGIYGYRTRKSKRSIEAWNFAQTYSAKLMIITSLFFLVFVVIEHFIIPYNIITDITFILIKIGFLVILPIYLTEKKLKEKFSEED